MNYTIDDLIRMIGLKEIEIALLRSRVTELEKQLPEKKNSSKDIAGEKTGVK